MTWDGLILVALGLGLLWAARDAAEVHSDIQEALRERFRTEHPRAPGWLARGLLPSWRRSAPVGNVVISLIVIAAGVLRFAGVW